MQTIQIPRQNKITFIILINIQVEHMIEGMH